MRNLIKKNPRYSKRINYEALRDLFDGGGPAGASALEEKMDADEGLWRIDQDKEDEDLDVGGGVVIEESGGAVGLTPKASTPGAAPRPSAATAEAVAELDEADAEGSEKGEEFVEEWDAYEQEV